MSSGKAYEIRMICDILKIDQESEEAKELWDFKYSALVVKRKELEKKKQQQQETDGIDLTGAYRFSSFNCQDDV